MEREMQHRNKRGGFSLVEMLVAISIMMILSGVMVGYSRSSEKQIALTTDRERVISVVNHVRDLSLATAYVAGKKVCGYGILFGQQTMQIYSTVKDTSNQCPDPSLGGTVVESYSLDPRLTFKTKPSYLFFTSPYLNVTSSAIFPAIITITAGGTFSDASLEVSGGGAPAPIIQ